MKLTLSILYILKNLRNLTNLHILAKDKLARSVPRINSRNKGITVTKSIMFRKFRQYFFLLLAKMKPFNKSAKINIQEENYIAAKL